MNIDQLYETWDEDCKINENHLDRESVRTPNLHAKYLRFLIQHKMRLAALETEYKLLRQKKFRYYRGEMPKPELEENGWQQWQGIKPLKNEMEEFLDGDADLNKISIKCAYIKNMIEALDAILGQIKSRDWQIRNAIQWKQFVAGS
jgi:hypothetical protein